MNQIRYRVHGTITPQKDSAIIRDAIDATEELAQQVISAISTDVEITLAGKEIHLAMLLDSTHWETDWNEIGVEDPDAFIASLLEEWHR